MGHFRALPGASRAAGATLNSVGRRAAAAGGDDERADGHRRRGRAAEAGRRALPHMLRQFLAAVACSTSRHVLKLEDYGGDDENSWVLLEEAKPAPRVMHVARYVM